MKLKTLMIAALLVGSAPALAQQSRRAGTNEFYMSPIFTNSKSFSFEGGTSARTDTGYGFGIGFARNFTPNLSAGVELAWSEMYYRTTLQPAAGNPGAAINSSGNISTGTLRFTGTWNILPTELTPFLTGGGGWTHIYTDIPVGPPQNSCWYYPWWGPVCTSYIPTQNTTKFSWNAGGGLRWDIGPYVVRGLVNAQYADIGGSQGNTYFTQYRLDFGMRFR
jgi:opacity protein-like surface antigen